MKHRHARLRAVLYAAKCYWPGVRRIDLDQVAARAADPGSEPGTRDVEYRGSLLFSDDDLVLCLFEGPSRAAIKRASDRAGIPCERVMNSTWLAPHGRATRAEPSISHQRRQA